MSYDIEFRVKVEGIDKYISVGDCDANITWNVRDIIMKSTGLEWKNEENNGLCKDVLPKIAKGLSELVVDGDKYRAYEAKNGWGTVNGTIFFFSEIIDAWRKLRCEDPELAEVATFWIV